LIFKSLLESTCKSVVAVPEIMTIKDSAMMRFEECCPRRPSKYFLALIFQSDELISLVFLGISTTNKKVALNNINQLL